MPVGDLCLRGALWNAGDSALEQLLHLADLLGLDLLLGQLGARLAGGGGLRRVGAVALGGRLWATCGSGGVEGGDHGKGGLVSNASVRLVHGDAVPDFIHVAVLLTIGLERRRRGQHIHIRLLSR